jgi:hypothetical protein
MRRVSPGLGTRTRGAEPLLVDEVVSDQRPGEIAAAPHLTLSLEMGTREQVRMQIPLRASVARAPGSTRSRRATSERLRLIS